MDAATLHLTGYERGLIRCRLKMYVCSIFIRSQVAGVRRSEPVSNSVDHLTEVYLITAVEQDTLSE